MNIYDIDHQIAGLLEQIDPETGELLVDFDRLDQLQMERDRKVENLGLAIKNLTADAVALAREIDNLEAKKKSTEKRIKSLKEYLMGVLDGDKFKTPLINIYAQSHTGVVYEDEAEFIEWAQEHDDSLLRYASPTINKQEVLRRLKAGQEINGAALNTTASLVVR